MGHASGEELGGIKQVPIVRPEGLPEEKFLQEVRGILASRQLTNGSQVRELEEASAAYLRVEHCVAVSSCTLGLLLTLRALDLRGEVIVPSFTFHATAHSIVWNGLKPVFADCDPQTFCIDADSAREKITSRTSAIVAVHMFGCPAAVSRLEKISRDYGIPLIFDAAHAFGSKLDEKHVGGFGAAEVFSFSPTKLVVAGEGGLITTRDAALARRLRVARNYGDAGDSDPEVLGLNARMSEIHAALALQGLGGVCARIERRNEIRREYRRQLKSVPGIQFQEMEQGSRSACKDMSLLVNDVEFGNTRDWLRLFLGEHHIETRRYFWPSVHQQKLYRDVWDGQPLPVTERVAQQVLNLPIYSSLSDEEVARICETVHRAFELAQRQQCGGHGQRRIPKANVRLLVAAKRAAQRGPQ
jgi:dTDP-4-amino-4,6-dideoxygalactose transaminase